MTNDRLSAEGDSPRVNRGQHASPSSPTKKIEGRPSDALARKVRAYRLLRHMTQDDLAARMTHLCHSWGGARRSARWRGGAGMSPSTSFSVRLRGLVMGASRCGRARWDPSNAGLGTTDREARRSTIRSRDRFRLRRTKLGDRRSGRGWYGARHTRRLFSLVRSRGGDRQPHDSGGCGAALRRP